MNKRNPDALKFFVAAARPDFLLGAFLFYALGAGVVHYLGNPIDWVAYWVGQCMVTLIQLSSAFLFAYFNFEALKEKVDLDQASITDEEKDAVPPNLGRNRVEEQVLRLSFLQAALVALTIGAVFTVMMSINGRITGSAYFFIGISLAAGLAYALPPANLGRTGFAELILTLFLTLLAPAFAYVLQEGEIHRLLAWLSFPLSFLVLASLLALSLEKYQKPHITARTNLMNQMGWQKGMQLHHILVFSAYLLIGLAAVAGLPWALTWPAILSMPFGLFQVWQLSQISSGSKPHWKLLKWTAYGVAGMTAYLVALALWTS